MPCGKSCRSYQLKNTSGTYSGFIIPETPPVNYSQSDVGIQCTCPPKRKVPADSVYVQGKFRKPNSIIKQELDVIPETSNNEIDENSGNWDDLDNEYSIENFPDNWVLQGQEQKKFKKSFDVPIRDSVQIIRENLQKDNSSDQIMRESYSKDFKFDDSTVRFKSTVEYTGSIYNVEDVPFKKTSINEQPEVIDPLPKEDFFESLISSDDVTPSPRVSIKDKAEVIETPKLEPTDSDNSASNEKTGDKRKFSKNADMSNDSETTADERRRRKDPDFQPSKDPSTIYENSGNKRNTDQYVGEILPPVPTSGPPPPPEGGEELWDLQFCKWWGWNWVKRRDGGDGPVRYSYPSQGTQGVRRCGCGNEINKFQNKPCKNDELKYSGTKGTSCGCTQKVGFCRRLFNCLCKKRQIVQCSHCDCGVYKVENQQPFCKCCKLKIQPEKIKLCRCKIEKPNARNICKCVENPEMLYRRRSRCYREPCRHYDVRRKNDSDCMIGVNYSCNSFQDDMDRVSVKLHEKNRKCRRYVCYPSKCDEDTKQKVISESNNNNYNYRRSSDKFTTNYWLKSYLPRLSKLDLQKKLSKFGRPYNTFSWLDKQLNNDKLMYRDEFKSPLSGKTYSLNIAKVTSSNPMKSSCLPEPVDPKVDNYFQINNTQFNQCVKPSTDLANTDLLQDVKYNLSKIENLMNKLLKDKTYMTSDNRSMTSNWSKETTGSSTRNERELNVIEESTTCSSKNSIRACKRSLSDISIPIEPKKLKVLNQNRSINEVFQRVYEYFDSGQMTFGTIENLMISPCVETPEMGVIHEESDEESVIQKHSLHSATTYDKNDLSPHTNRSLEVPLEGTTSPRTLHSRIPIRKKY